MILFKKIRHRIILVLNKRRIKCQRRCAWRNMMFYIFGKIVQKGLFYYDNEASIDPLLRKIVAFRFICLLSLLFFFFFSFFFFKESFSSRRNILWEKNNHCLPSLKGPGVKGLTSLCWVKISMHGNYTWTGRAKNAL